MASNERVDDTMQEAGTKGVVKKNRRPGKKVPSKRDVKSAAATSMRGNVNNPGVVPDRQYSSRPLKQPGLLYSKFAPPPMYNIRKERCHRERIIMPDPSKPEEPYFCTLCFYRCQSWDAVERHINQARHQQMVADSEDKECSLLLPKPNPVQMECFTRVIQDVVQENDINLFDRLERNRIASYIDGELQHRVEGCRVHLYGSSLAAGLKNSDVNLNLTVPSGLSPHKVMKIVLQLLEDHSDTVKVELDFKSDLPKILFDNKFNKLHCVLCLNQRNAVEISKLLSKYEEMDKRVHPLSVIFRLWAKECLLDRVDSGTLPPYAFSLMTVFYLQQMKDPVLPVIQEFIERELVTMEFTDDELKSLRRWKSHNKMSIGELWWGLLHFYLFDFDMSDKVVSIRTRLPVLRTSKKWTGRGMAIEDPFIPKKNIARHVGQSSVFKYFMSCLLSTYKYFTIPQTSKGPIFHQVKPMPNMSFDTVIEKVEAVLKDPIFQKTDGYLEDIKDKLRKLTVDNHGEKTATLVNELTNTKQFEEVDCGTEKSRITVSPFQAEEMCNRLNGTFLVYRFEGEHFTGGKELPKLCVLCREEGHSNTECTANVLPPVEKLPPLSARFLNVVTCVCEHLFECYRLDEEQFYVRQRIVRKLEEVLKRGYPGIQLSMFGSSCNGFGLISSDIDVCASFSHNRTGEGLSFAEMVEQFGHFLQRCPDFRNLVPVTTAKVPILKFYHPESRLEGDISLYNFLGGINTKLLKAYADIDIRAKILGLVMKRFTKLCDICDASRGSLSSYTYILMVIHFLQQCDPPVLPVLQELPHCNTLPVRMVENCNTYYFTDLKNLPKVWPGYGKNNASVGELWIQLLCYYTEVFDFEQHIISVRQKAPLLRKDKFWSSAQIAVEDPFDQNHNLASNLSRKMHTFILQSFRKARLHFGYTRNIPFLNLRQLMLYFFTSQDLTVGSVPNERGCHYCGKMGHKVKDCPVKKKRSKAENSSESDHRAPQRGRKPHHQRKYQFDLLPG
ncbi:terminal uridylyltransferase 7 [Anabrus simplex]|uniref:terminal uridylyltransferase 7 n=1 Tax=Anabrus simplex TaxID=316456 RepID=UPI0035A2E0C0